jgi:hypothetical protein
VGEPVYFTYDPHWTRLGHEVVARCVERLPILRKGTGGGDGGTPGVFACRGGPRGGTELVEAGPGG